MLLILCILGRNVTCSSFSSPALPSRQGGSGVLWCGSLVVAVGKVPEWVWEQQGAAGALDWGELRCAPLCANIGAGGACAPWPAEPLCHVFSAEAAVAAVAPRGMGQPRGCSWQSRLRAELAFAHQKYPLLPQERSVPVHPPPGFQGWGTLGALGPPEPVGTNKSS